MSEFSRAFSLAILVALGHASALLADPVLITDNRSVLAAASVGSESPVSDLQEPSEPFAPFVGLASAFRIEGLISAQTVATQRSSVGPRLFSASGTVDSSAAGAGESFDSTFTAGSSL